MELQNGVRIESLAIEVFQFVIVSQNFLSNSETSVDGFTPYVCLCSYGSCFVF